MDASRFPKERRLRTRAEFERVQNGAGVDRAHARHFLLLRLSRESGPARLGVVASRRVGSSVLRNRAKRLVRQFFRVRAAGLGAFDLVVVVKTGAGELNQAAVDAELAAALAKLGAA